MSTAIDPQAEYERVSAKYAAAAWRDALIALAILVALIVADRFINISWASTREPSSASSDPRFATSD